MPGTAWLPNLSVKRVVNCIINIIYEIAMIVIAIYSMFAAVLVSLLLPSFFILSCAEILLTPHTGKPFHQRPCTGTAAWIRSVSPFASWCRPRISTGISAPILPVSVSSGT
jgi:hypothetical protein